MCPELLFGLIVSPRMRDNEAILLRGAEQVAQGAGYRREFRYSGTHDDTTPRNATGSPDTEITAIDAINFGGGASLSEQGTPANVLRELNKARAGFRRTAVGPQRAVATGGWGCGAFGGDPALKSVIQWLAASAEGRDVRYHRLYDPRPEGLAAFVGRARERFATVGALYAGLCAEIERNGKARAAFVLDWG